MAEVGPELPASPINDRRNGVEPWPVPGEVSGFAQWSVDYIMQTIAPGGAYAYFLGAQ